MPPTAHASHDSPPSREPEPQELDLDLHLPDDALELHDDLHDDDVRSIPLVSASDIPAFFARGDVVEPEREVAGPHEFSVRTAYSLHGFLAGGAGLLALGFVVAATRTDGFAAGWRWVLAAVFAVLAGFGVRELLAKPLLVADDTGIRLRIRRDWIGAPWEEIEAVTVLPRRHLLDDGRIAIHLADPGPVVAAIARDATRATRNLTDTNRRLTGSSLAVPFGLAATPSDPAVVAALTALAGDRCPVTEQP